MLRGHIGPHLYAQLRTSIQVSYLMGQFNVSYLFVIAKRAQGVEAYSTACHRTVRETASGSLHYLGISPLLLSRAFLNLAW